MESQILNDSKGVWSQLQKLGRCPFCGKPLELRKGKNTRFVCLNNGCGLISVVYRRGQPPKFVFDTVKANRLVRPQILREETSLGNAKKFRS